MVRLLVVGSLCLALRGVAIRVDDNSSDHLDMKGFFLPLDQIFEKHWSTTTVFSESVKIEAKDLPCYGEAVTCTFSGALTSKRAESSTTTVSATFTAEAKVTLFKFFSAYIDVDISVQFDIQNGADVKTVFVAWALKKTVIIAKNAIDGVVGAAVNCWRNMVDLAKNVAGGVLTFFENIWNGAKGLIHDWLAAISGGDPEADVVKSWKTGTQTLKDHIARKHCNKPKLIHDLTDDVMNSVSQESDAYNTGRDRMHELSLALHAYELLEMYEGKMDGHVLLVKASNIANYSLLVYNFMTCFLPPDCTFGEQNWKTLIPPPDGYKSDDECVNYWGNNFRADNGLWSVPRMFEETMTMSSKLWCDVFKTGIPTGTILGHPIDSEWVQNATKSLIEGDLKFGAAEKCHDAPASADCIKGRAELLRALMISRDPFDIVHILVLGTRGGTSSPASNIEIVKTWGNYVADEGDGGLQNLKGSALFTVGLEVAAGKWATLSVSAKAGAYISQNGFEFQGPTPTASVTIGKWFAAKVEKSDVLSPTDWVNVTISYTNKVAFGKEEVKKKTDFGEETTVEDMDDSSAGSRSNRVIDFVTGLPAVIQTMMKAQQGKDISGLDALGFLKAALETLNVGLVAGGLVVNTFGKPQLPELMTLVLNFAKKAPGALEFLLNFLKKEFTNVMWEENQGLGVAIEEDRSMDVTFAWKNKQMTAMTWGMSSTQTVGVNFELFHKGVRGYVGQGATVTLTCSSDTTGAKAVDRGKVSTANSNTPQGSEDQCIAERPHSTPTEELMQKKQKHAS